MGLYPVLFKRWFFRRYRLFFDRFRMSLSGALACLQDNLTGDFSARGTASKKFWESEEIYPKFACRIEVFAV
jgi:hypothetical protein